jgi:hypothetical protein
MTLLMPLASRLTGALRLQSAHVAHLGHRFRPSLSLPPAFAHRLAMRLADRLSAPGRKILLSQSLAGFTSRGTTTAIISECN